MVRNTDIIKFENRVDGVCKFTTLVRMEDGQYFRLFVTHVLGYLTKDVNEMTFEEVFLYKEEDFTDSVRKHKMYLWVTGKDYTDYSPYKYCSLECEKWVKYKSSY